MVADSLFDQDDDGIVVVLVDEVPGDERTAPVKRSKCARRRH
jgi:hypothetical protein